MGRWHEPSLFTTLLWDPRTVSRTLKKKKNLVKTSSIWGIVKYLNHCKYFIRFFCIPSKRQIQGQSPGCLFCRNAEPSSRVFLFFPLSLTRSALWAAWKEFTINKECIVNTSNKIVTQSVSLRAGAVIYESSVRLISQPLLRCWELAEWNPESTRSVGHCTKGPCSERALSQP